MEPGAWPDEGGARVCELPRRMIIILLDMFILIITRFCCFSTFEVLIVVCYTNGGEDEKGVS
jgi:hypothetical protein